MNKLSLLLIMCFTAMAMNAQVFVENFESATVGGDLEGYNDWYVSFKAADAMGVSPKIEDETLFYDGYASSDMGKVAVLDSLMGQTDDTKRITTRVIAFGTDTLRPVVGQKMYAAFMVQFQPNSKNSYRDFFTWEGSSGSSWTRGRVFAKRIGESDIQLAVSKNSSGDLAESEVISGGIGLNHLLVLSYEAVEGDKNDIVTLYINPDLSKGEADQTLKLVNIDTQSDYSESTKIKINLRQRAVGAWIGGIRVARTWDEAVITNPAPKKFSGVVSENFETATVGGPIEGYNDWYVSKKAADAMGVSPMVEDETLFFDNYAGSDIGRVAVLDSLMGQTDDTKRISTKIIAHDGDTLQPVIGGKMYAAFMVQFQPNSKNSYRDFFTWEGSSGSSWTRGRVFAKRIGESDIQLAVSKNSSGDLAESEVISGGIGLNHLLVLAYEAVEGDKNDVITLYINPDPTKAEADQTLKLVNIDTQSDYSEGTKIKINLRQRAVGAWIGGIRVGIDWQEVLQGDGTAIRTISTVTSKISSYGRTIVTPDEGRVRVYNLAGIEVLNRRTNGKLETSMKDGLYIVRFQDNNGKVSTGKVILR